MDTNQIALMDERVADFCEALTTKHVQDYPRLTDTDLWMPVPVKRAGQRWQAIATHDYRADLGEWRKSGIHTWLDRTTGDIVYGAVVGPTRHPATKTQPARYARRYNVLDDASFATMMIRFITGEVHWLYQDSVTEACI